MTSSLLHRLVQNYRLLNIVFFIFSFFSISFLASATTTVFAEPIPTADGRFTFDTTSVKTWPDDFSFDPLDFSAQNSLVIIENLFEIGTLRISKMSDLNNRRLLVRNCTLANLEFPAAGEVVGASSKLQNVHITIENNTLNVIFVKKTFFDVGGDKSRFEIVNNTFLSSMRLFWWLPVNGATPNDPLTTRVFLFVDWSFSREPTMIYKVSNNTFLPQIYDVFDFRPGTLSANATWSFTAMRVHVGFAHYHTRVDADAATLPIALGRAEISDNLILGHVSGHGQYGVVHLHIGNIHTYNSITINSIAMSNNGISFLRLAQSGSPFPLLKLSAAPHWSSRPPVRVTGSVVCDGNAAWQPRNSKTIVRLIEGNVRFLDVPLLSLSGNSLVKEVEADLAESDGNDDARLQDQVASIIYFNLEYLAESSLYFSTSTGGPGGGSSGGGIWLIENNFVNYSTPGRINAIEFSARNQSVAHMILFRNNTLLSTDYAGASGIALTVAALRGLPPSAAALAVLRSSPNYFSSSISTYSSLSPSALAALLKTRTFASRGSGAKFIAEDNFCDFNVSWASPRRNMNFLGKRQVCFTMDDASEKTGDVPDQTLTSRGDPHYFGIKNFELVSLSRQRAVVVGLGATFGAVFFRMQFADVDRVIACENDAVVNARADSAARYYDALDLGFLGSPGTSDTSIVRLSLVGMTQRIGLLSVFNNTGSAFTDTTKSGVLFLVAADQDFSAPKWTLWLEDVRVEIANNTASYYRSEFYASSETIFTGIAFANVNSHVRPPFSFLITNNRLNITSLAPCPYSGCGAVSFVITKSGLHVEDVIITRNIFIINTRSSGTCGITINIGSTEKPSESAAMTGTVYVYGMSGSVRIDRINVSENVLLGLSDESVNLGVNVGVSGDLAQKNDAGEIVGAGIGEFTAINNFIEFGRRFSSFEKYANSSGLSEEQLQQREEEARKKQQQPRAQQFSTLRSCAFAFGSLRSTLLVPNFLDGGKTVATVATKSGSSTMHIDKIHLGKNTVTHLVAGAVSAYDGAEAAEGGGAPPRHLVEFSSNGRIGLFVWDGEDGENENQNENKKETTEFVADFSALEAKMHQAAKTISPFFYSVFRQNFDKYGIAVPFAVIQPDGDPKDASNKNLLTISNFLVKRQRIKIQLPTCGDSKALDSTFLAAASVRVPPKLLYSRRAGFVHGFRLSAESSLSIDNVSFDLFCGNEQRDAKTLSLFAFGRAPLLGVSLLGLRVGISSAGSTTARTLRLIAVGAGSGVSSSSPSSSSLSSPRVNISNLNVLSGDAVGGGGGSSDDDALVASAIAPPPEPDSEFSPAHIALRVVCSNWFASPVTEKSRCVRASLVSSDDVRPCPGVFVSRSPSRSASDTGTRNDTRSRSRETMSASESYAPPAPDIGLAAALVQNLENAAAVGTAAAAAVGGSPSALLAASRSSLFLRLAMCKMRLESTPGGINSLLYQNYSRDYLTRQLSFPESLIPGFTIAAKTSPIGAYVRGAIVANIFVIGFLFCGVIFVANINKQAWVRICLRAAAASAQNNNNSNNNLHSSDELGGDNQFSSLSPEQIAAAEYLRYNSRDLFAAASQNDENDDGNENSSTTSSPTRTTSRDLHQALVDHASDTSFWKFAPIDRIFLKAVIILLPSWCSLAGALSAANDLQQGGSSSSSSSSKLSAGDTWLALSPLVIIALFCLFCAKYIDIAIMSDGSSSKKSDDENENENNLSRISTNRSNRNRANGGGRNDDNEDDEIELVDFSSSQQQQRSTSTFSASSSSSARRSFSASSSPTNQNRSENRPQSRSQSRSRSQQQQQQLPSAASSSAAAAAAAQRAYPSSIDGVLARTPGVAIVDIYSRHRNNNNNNNNSNSNSTNRHHSQQFQAQQQGQGVGDDEEKKYQFVTEESHVFFAPGATEPWQRFVHRSMQHAAGRFFFVGNHCWRNHYSLLQPFSILPGPGPFTQFPWLFMTFSGPRLEKVAKKTKNNKSRNRDDHHDDEDLDETLLNRHHNNNNSNNHDDTYENERRSRSRRSRQSAATSETRRRRRRQQQQSDQEDNDDQEEPTLIYKNSWRHRAATWWVFVNIVITIVTSLISGSSNVSPTTCMSSLYVNLVFQIISVIAALVVRAYIVPFRNIATAVIECSALLAAVLFIFVITDSSGGEDSGSGVGGDKSSSSAASSASTTRNSLESLQGQIATAQLLSTLPAAILGPIVTVFGVLRIGLLKVTKAKMVAQRALRKHFILELEQAEERLRRGLAGETVEEKKDERTCWEKVTQGDLTSWFFDD